MRKANGCCLDLCFPPAILWLRLAAWLPHYGFTTHVNAACFSTCPLLSLLCCLWALYPPLASWFLSGCCDWQFGFLLSLHPPLSVVPGPLLFTSLCLKKLICSRIWWFTSVILALGRCNQEDQEFKIILYSYILQNYTVSFEASLGCIRPCLKQQQQQQQSTNKASWHRDRAGYAIPIFVSRPVFHPFRSQAVYGGHYLAVPLFIA